MQFKYSSSSRKAMFSIQSVECVRLESIENVVIGIEIFVVVQVLAFVVSVCFSGDRLSCNILFSPINRRNNILEK